MEADDDNSDTLNFEEFKNFFKYFLRLKGAVSGMLPTIVWTYCTSRVKRKNILLLRKTSFLEYKLGFGRWAYEISLF